MKTPTCNRREFLAATATAAGVAAACGTAFPAGAAGMATQTSDTCLETSAVFPVPDPSRLRVLQFTDIHFFREREDPAPDRQTLEDLPRLVEHTSPDLLLVTGDLWHDNPDHRGEEFMHFGIEQIAALGIPWVFTWGNHDELDDYPKGHDAFRAAPHSRYRGGSGGGNYAVLAQDRQGVPVWEFICLNSMERGLLQPQRDWLKALREQWDTAPHAEHAFLVVHIPVKQYDEIWNAGAASGVKLEEVCFWDEDGTAFPLIKALGTVRAGFCGHDHVNDYAGVIDGIELIYGRATGSGGYGGGSVPKGAKLITVNTETASYVAETVLPDGSRWRPEAGIQIDAVLDTPWAGSLRD